MAVTEADFKAAMASFGSGVVVVTTTDASGVPYGFTATSFASVSKSPPLCLVCPGHAAEALPALRAEKRFAVNILSRSQEALSVKFATHGIDKFDGVPFRLGKETACPLLDGALVALECRTETLLTAGDHDVLIGRILAIEVDAGDPLFYFRGRYRELSGG